MPYQYDSNFITYNSEPKNRGVMIAYTNVCGTLGMSFVYVLNTWMPWRMVGLMCMLIPIFTVFALCFVSIYNPHSVCETL